jgi:hypothetical protein
VVLVNFGADGRAVALAGSWAVEVDSLGQADGAAFAGRLAGDCAVVLRPA